MSRLASRRPAVSAGLALWLLGGATAGHAAPPPGDYRLEEGHRSFEIAAWGADCGPKPASRRFGAGGRYTLDAAGWLRPSGDAPAVFQPDICQAATGIPSLKSAAAGARVRCASAVPAQSVTGYVQRDDRDPNRLVVSERLAYDWVLKGSRCTLTQHARFVLRRAQPLDRCQTPGPLAQLERQGAARQRVIAGRALRFRVEGQDAAGCAVAVRPTWASTHGEISAEGVLRIPAGQAAAAAEVTARDGEAVVRWQVTIQAARPREASRLEPEVGVEELLPEWIEPGIEAEGLPLDPDAAPQISGAASAEVGAPRPQERSPLFIGLFVGLALAALALSAWIVWSSRRLRRPPRRLRALLSGRPAADPDPPSGPALAGGPLPPEDPARSAAARRPSAPAGGPRPTPAPGPVSAPALPGPAGPQAARCPQCARAFPAGARFCPYDGAALEPEDEPALLAGLDSSPPPPAPEDLEATVAMPALQAKVCPVCETRYPEEAEFCGLDGARLVLLN